MPTDAFQKLRDSTGRAITKISVKTSSTLEKSKIKMHIDSLNKDVQIRLQEIGEVVYTLWIQGETAGQELTEKLNAVKQKREEIARLTSQLDSIDARDDEILGINLESIQATESSGTLNCPNCGTEFSATAKFCRKCGTKL